MRNEATIALDELAASGGARFIRRSGEQETEEFIRGRVPGPSLWAREAPATIAAYAARSTPFIVEGGPGAGKEFVARLVHECSSRASRPFVVVPADSLHEAVLQAILFEAPGALPPATRALQRDYAEQARGGTIYIADVSPLSTELHRRIARFIAQPQLEHTRRHSLHGCHVRIVFGSCLAVGAEALCIPSLGDRAEDVAALAEHFATQLCHRLGKEPRVLSPGALATLRAHSWPGNVGELKHVVESMVRRSGPPILDASLVPLGTSLAEPFESSINLHDEVQRYEKSLLFAALERCAGVQTKAAQLLGMKVSTLNSKLSNYNIDASAFKS